MKAKELEKILLDVYAEFKYAIPNLNRITFELTEHLLDNKTPYLSGFYHIGLECEMFDNISELYAVLHETRRWREENEILFRRF